MLDQQRSPRTLLSIINLLLCGYILQPNSDLLGSLLVQVFLISKYLHSDIFHDVQMLAITCAAQADQHSWSCDWQSLYIRICCFCANACVSERRVDFSLFTCYCCWGSWYQTRSIVAFLVVLFVFWLNCVFWRLSGLLALVFLFCYSGVPVPVGYLCCHFWCVSCFISEDLSSSCCHCLHLLLRFLFIVATPVLSLSLPVYWIFVLLFAAVTLHTIMLPILSCRFPLNVHKQ